MIITKFSNKSATLQSRYPRRNSGLDEVMWLEQEASSSNATAHVTRMVLSFDVNYDELHYKGINLDSSTYTASLKLFNTNGGGNHDNVKTLSCAVLNKVAQNGEWNAGKGRVADYTTTEKDASWTNRYGTQATWSTAAGVTSPGGAILAGSPIANTNYDSTKDLVFTVTDATLLWTNADIANANNGFLIYQFEDTDTNIDQEQSKYEFFSSNTHTIYQPRLELGFDDSSYATSSTQLPIGLTTHNLDEYYAYLKSNNGSYKHGTIASFDINIRPKYTAKTYANAASANKEYVFETGVLTYAIIDAKTGERVIDFDRNNTKLSCSSTTGHFFNIWTDSLMKERYYSIQIGVGAISPNHATQFEPRKVFTIKDTFKITR